MITVLIAFGILAVLLVLGVPVAYALLTSTSVAVLAMADVPVAIVAQRAFAPTKDFLLLAIPFFILAGELMASGRLGQQLVGLASKVVGRFTGGLAHSSVVTSMLFAGVSGSAVADAAGLGSVLIPWQKRERYPAPFAAAVNAASSTVGVIIPPSIPMILYAAIAEQSVADLFLAGVLPGVLLGVGFMVVCWWSARRNGFPRHRDRLTPRGMLRDAAAAAPAVAMPVLVLAALIGGVATVTEVSVLAAGYALLLRLFLYRDLSLRGLTRALVNTAAATGVVMLLIMTSSALSWLLVVERVPAALSSWDLGVTGSTVAVILFMNVLMLLVGTFLDMPAAILLLAPVLLPLANGIGMDPLQLGIVMTLNLALGLYTPPVGSTLYISTSIAGVRIEQTTRALVPFYVTGLVVLLLVSFVPAMTLG